VSPSTSTFTPNAQQRNAIRKSLDGKGYTPSQVDLIADEVFDSSNGDIDLAVAKAGQYKNRIDAQVESQRAKLGEFATAEADSRGIGGEVSRSKYSDNIIKNVLGTSDSFDRSRFRDQIRSRSFGTTQGPSWNDVLQLASDPGKVLATQKMSKQARQQINKRALELGMDEIPLDDDFAWSEIEGRLQDNQTVLKPGGDVFRAGDVAKAAGLGVVEGITFGSLHAVDAALQVAGWTDQSYWTDVVENDAYIQSKYTTGAKHIGELAGFFVPGGFGGKLVQAGLKVGAKTGTKIIGKEAAKKLGKTAVGQAGKKTGEAAVKVATGLTKFTGKKLFEYPEHLIAKGAANIMGKGFASGFIKSSAAGLEEYGIAPTMSLLKKSLAKLPVIHELGKESGEALVGKALANTLTKAWKSARATTIRRLTDAGEEEALHAATAIFASEISGELARRLGQDVSSEVVKKATKQIVTAFTKEIRAGGGAKTFRKMLTQPLGIKAPGKGLLADFALTSAEGALGMGIHSSLVTMNTMLGHNAMLMESTEDVGFFERGKLYGTGAWELYEKQGGVSNFWKSAMIGALFHTGAGTKFVPGTVPLWGGKTFNLGKTPVLKYLARPEANFYDAAKKYIRGPKLSKDAAEQILAKEFTPAHEIIMNDVRSILGMKQAESVRHFLSRAATKAREPGGIVKATKAMFNRMKGIAKEPSKMGHKELAYTGALMRSMRANFETPLAGMRRGMARKMSPGSDGLSFLQRDLEILANAKKHPRGVVKAARLKVVASLEGNMNQIWNQYRKTAGKEMVRDFINVAGFRFPAVFMATGGVGMMKEWSEDGINFELGTNILSHGIMSLWAANGARFPDGIHLAPGGWHQGRIRAERADVLPGWSDARIELAGLERELMYMGAGSTNFYPEMGYSPVEKTINGIVGIKSHAELIDSFNGHMASNMARFMQAAGVSPSTGEELAQKVLSPGEKKAQFDFEVNYTTSTEREHALDILKAMAGTGKDIGDAFNIDGKNPVKDGTEWLKALDRMNESRRDVLLSLAAKSIKDSLIERDIMTEGEELTFSSLVRAVQKNDREVNAKVRSKAQDVLTSFRDEQVNGGLQAEDAQMTHQFRFEGKENDALNMRIENMLKIAKLYELGVGEVFVGGELELPGAKIRNDQDMFDVAKRMDKDVVIDALENFEAGLKELNIHEELNLNNIELPAMLSDNLQVAGRSLPSELMAYDQVLPILAEQEGQLTRTRVLEALRSGGLLDYDAQSQKYILKKVTRELLESLTEAKKNELLSLHYLARNEPDVYIPTDELYDNPASNLTLLDKSEVSGLWRKHTFAESSHPQVGKLQRFQFEGGIVGALRAVGIPLHSYEYAKATLGEINQHRLASLTDNEVAYMAVVDDIGYVRRSAKGRRLVMPTMLVGKTGRAVEGAEHDIIALVDAVRATVGDPSSTGDLRYDVVTSEALFDHAISGFREVYGKEPSDADILKLRGEANDSAIHAYEVMGQKLIDKGMYDGWDSSTGRLDGTPERIVVQEKDARMTADILETVLKPLADATNAKERRNMITEMRTKLMGRRQNAGRKLTKDIDWLHDRLGGLLERNDARSMRELHFLLRGTDAIKILQKGARRNVELDLTAFDKMDLEKVIERLEIIDHSDMQNEGIREKYLQRLEQAADELATLLPQKGMHEKNNSIQDILIEVGIGAGNETTRETLRELNSITRSLDASKHVDLGELRKRYIDALRTGVDNIHREGPAGEVRGAGDTSVLKTRSEMMDSVDRLTDSQVIKILHETSEQSRYAIVEPGETAYASIEHLRSPLREGGLEGEPVMDHQPKIAVGNSSVSYMNRKRNGIDVLMDLLGVKISELSNTNRANGNSLLHDRSERAHWAKSYLNDGMSAVDPSEKGDHLIRKDENGLPHINRVSTVELTDGRSMLVELPFTKPELTKFRDTIRDFAKGLDGRVGDNNSQSRMLDTMRQLADAIDTKIEAIENMPEGALRSYDIYDMILDGSTSGKELSNVYRMMLRQEIFGVGAMDQAVGTAGVKNNKRIKQIISNSAQQSTAMQMDLAMQMAVRRHDVEAGGPQGGDRFMELIDNMTDGLGLEREFRSLTVSEEQLAQLMGVEQLDGNLPIHPAAMELMVESYGYNPAEATYGTMKGFTHGPVRQGGEVHNIKQTTKPLFAVPSARVQTLMEKLGIAMIIPESSMKIGQKGDMMNFKEVMVDGTNYPIHEAAFRVKRRGGTVSRAEEGVINMRPEDIRFQLMPDTEANGATVTGQMALDWHPNVVKSFNEMFPADKMFDLATAVLGDINLDSMAMSRALMTDADLNPITTHGDVLHRRASIMNQMMLRTPYASPALFFRRPVENRVLSVMKSTLFKGHTDLGGKAMFSPDETNALDPMEFVFPGQDRLLATRVDRANFGVKRTKRLVRSESGRIQLDADGRPMTEQFSYDHADAHQARVMGFQGDNYFNTPSQGVEGIAGRRSTWTDHPLLGKGKENALFSILEEWYAGGRTEAPMSRETPLQGLFKPENLGPGQFDSAAGKVVDVLREVLQNSDVGALTRNGGRIDSLVKDLNLAFTGDKSTEIDRFATELKDFVRHDLHGGATGNGLSASGKDGHIAQGTLKNIFDMLFGNRQGESWSESDGWQYENRMKSADGKVELADHEGKTPVTYGQLMVMQRSPSAKPNDTVAMHALGWLREAQGRQMVGGRKDTAGIMEADNDGDKANYMNSLPREVIAETLRLRNLMGGLGAQKGDVNEPGYTYLVDKKADEFSAAEEGSNQYLRYIADQAQAEIMKGQMISVRAAVSKMIADNVSISYIAGGESVRIRPTGDYAKIMESGVSDMITLLQRIQQVLDVPGSFMPKELKGVNLDEAVFGPIMKKQTREGGFDKYQAETGDPSAQGSKGDLNERDMKILGALRRVYTKIGSISRDEFAGGETRAKSWSTIYDIAQEYVDIFHTNGKTAEQGLKDHLTQELQYLGEADASINDAIQSMQFKTQNNVLFPDAVAQWVVRTGKAMNGNLISNDSYTAAMGREATLIGVGESPVLKKLRRIQGLQEMRQYIQYLKVRAGEEQGPNRHYRDSYTIEKAKAREAEAEARKMELTIDSPRGDELKALQATTIEGLALFSTLASTPEMMTEKMAGYADAEAQQIRIARSQMWMKELGAGEGMADTRSIVKDRVREVYLDSYVRQYFQKYLNSERSNFDELALRLIEPERLSLYKYKGSNYFSYKGMPMDVIQAMMKYDGTGTSRLLARIGENGMVTAEVFRNGTLKNIRELQEVVTEREGWEGRVGEARTLMRNSLDWNMRNPIEESIKMLATRRPTEVKLNEMKDYIASGEGGGALRIKDKLLRTVMESATNLEFNPAKNLFVDVKPMKRAQTNIPGVRELMPFDFEGTIMADIRAERINRLENTALWKDVEASYRKRQVDEKNAIKNASLDPEVRAKPNLRAQDLFLSKNDIAAIGKLALKRQEALSGLISRGISNLEAQTKDSDIKDFDNGLGSSGNELEREIHDMGANTQHEKNRENARKKGKNNGEC